jgi:hypothetical protein
MDELETTSETIDIVSEGVKILGSDLQRLRIESDHAGNVLQPIVQELPKIKKSIDEQNTLVDGMKTNQENCTKAVLSMEQQLEDMKSSTYDGTYIWKITNVQEKIGEISGFMKF